MSGETLKVGDYEFDFVMPDFDNLEYGEAEDQLETSVKNWLNDWRKIYNKQLRKKKLKRILCQKKQ